MINERDKRYFLHITQAIADIERYMRGVTKEEFAKDDMRRNAVVRLLEVIGEAARNVSEECKRSYPDIAWRDSTDMRNFLIHQYFHLDIKSVWDTVQDDLPALKQEIGKALNG
jgi:uncharacterized protein with HEPN domain